MLQTDNTNDIYYPNTLDQLVRFLKKNEKPISICGAGYTPSSHWTPEDGFIINLINLNRISVDLNDQTYEVEGGATWKQVFNKLLKHNLIPQVCDEYLEYTVGGSISTNCTGYQMKNIHESIVNIKVVTVKGEIIMCDKNNNAEVYTSVIETYGMIGIIGSVKLKGIFNNIIKCKIIKCFSDSLNDEINKITKKYELMVYKIRICIKTSQIYHICWIKESGYYMVDGPLLNTQHNLIDVNKKISWEPICQIYNNLYYSNKDKTVSRLSYEVIESIKNKINQYEIYVPIHNIDNILRELLTLISTYNLNMTNMILKYITGSPIMIGIKMYMTDDSNQMKYMKKCYKLVIKYAGKWYLGNRCMYTREDVLIGYPQILEVINWKMKYDPDWILRSKFWMYLVDILKNKEII